MKKGVDNLAYKRVPSVFKNKPVPGTFKKSTSVSKGSLSAKGSQKLIGPSVSMLVDALPIQEEPSSSEHARKSNASKIKGQLDQAENARSHKIFEDIGLSAISGLLTSEDGTKS